MHELQWLKERYFEPVCHANIFLLFKTAYTTSRLKCTDNLESKKKKKLAEKNLVS